MIMETAVNPRFILIGFMLLLAACSPRTYEAMAILDDLSSGLAPSRLKADTPAPRREGVSYMVEDRRYRADLYRPNLGENGGVPEKGTTAVVLVPGVARAGKDDPRLQAFAQTLARSRFTVLVPDLENLRQLRVGIGDVTGIADAVKYLSGETGRAVGLVAFSYASGPAFLAAMEPGISNKVSFLITVGGYYDTEAVITFFTTGYFREGPGHPWRKGTPNVYGKWVFIKSNTGRLENPRDRVALSAMAARKLDDANASVLDLAAKLGPEGKSVYALLENDDPDNVPHLIAALPDGARDDIAALDLKAHDITRLKADVFLFHGRDDRIIPYTESVKLAGVLGGKKTGLYLVESLKHVDFTPTGIADRITLTRAITRLLEIRDRE